MKPLLTKNSQSDCVFQLILGLEENYSPSPLGDFNRLFGGQIWVSFQIWHWNMLYFVLNGINLAPKMKIRIIALLVKASRLHCSLHNQKVNKPGFHAASCTIQHLNTKVQCSLPTAAYRWQVEWRWQPQQNLLNSVFYPLYKCLLVSLNAEVLVVVVVVAVCRAPDHWSPLSAASQRFSLTLNARKGGIKTILKNLCYKAD